MNVVLWVIQSLLTLSFLASGLAKLSLPINRLRDMYGWMKQVSPRNIRLIGSLEIAGATGLLLPAALHILPWLTVAAAIGVVLLMFSAAVLHIRLNESPKSIPSFVFLLLAAVIVIGRLYIAPFA